MVTPNIEKSRALLNLRTMFALSIHGGKVLGESRGGSYKTPLW